MTRRPFFNLFRFLRIALLCGLGAVATAVSAYSTNIQQVSSNAVYALPLGKSLAQTFTVPETMRITAVGFKTNGAELDIALYRGEGRNGTPIYSKSRVFFINATLDMHTISPAITLTGGEVYTWVITNNSVGEIYGDSRLINNFVHGLAEPPRDPYPEGKRILLDPGPDVIDFDSDLVFRIQSGTDLDLSGNDLLIRSGDSTPRVNDNTDFGSLITRHEIETRTFELTNVSGRPISLGTVTVSDDTNFKISRQPAGSLAAGATTTFDITFEPINISREALQTISIPSNGQPNPYEFVVKGVALMDTIPPEPEITGPGGTQSGQFLVAVDFGEPVSGFSQADLSVSNGSVVSLSGIGGGQYQVEIQPEAEGEVTVFLAADRANDLFLNDNLASNTYAVDYIPPFTVEGDDGEPYESPIVPQGERYQFSIQGGSGDFNYDAFVRNEYGRLGYVTRSDNNNYEFTTGASGAFAGTYEAEITDNVSGYVRTLEFIVPLKVELERSTLLESGPRSESVVRVLGAETGSALSLSIESTSADGVPVLTGTEITAPDDTVSGNAAISTVTAVSLPDDPVEFDITVSAFNYEGSTVSGQVVPTTLYSGLLSDYLGNGLDQVTVSLISDDEAATVQRDELNEAYVAQTGTEGDFTLAVPETLTGNPLALQFVGDGLALRTVAADTCLTGGDGCTLELTYAESAEEPVLDQPSGIYQDQVMVEITTATAGASISVTLDGSDPTPSNGQIIESGDVIILRESAVMQAVAFMEGLAPSGIAQAGYAIENTSSDDGAEGENDGDSSGNSGGSLGLWSALLALLILVSTRLRRYRRSL